MENSKPLTWNDIYQIFGHVLIESDLKKINPNFKNALTRQYLKEKFQKNELYFNEAKDIFNITRGLKIILGLTKPSIESHNTTDDLVIQLASACFSEHVCSLIEDIADEQNLSPDEFTADLFSKINYLVVNEPKSFAKRKVKTKNKIK